MDGVEDNSSVGMEELENRFGFHKATIEGDAATQPKHQDLRMNYRATASYLDRTLPAGREKDLAITALEEASMWSHKAIAKTAPLESSTTEEVAPDA